MAKNPKYIFTSYGYHGDTIFSFYLANKVEQGSKYIYTNMDQIILLEKQ